MAAYPMNKSLSPILVYLPPLIGPLVLLITMFSPIPGFICCLTPGGVGLILWLASLLKHSLPKGHREAAVLIFFLTASPLIILIAIDTLSRFTRDYDTYGTALELAGLGMFALGLYLVFWILSIAACLWGLYQLRRDRPYLMVGS